MVAYVFFCVISLFVLLLYKAIFGGAFILFVLCLSFVQEYEQKLFVDCLGFFISAEF